MHAKLAPIAVLQPTHNGVELLPGTGSQMARRPLSALQCMVLECFVYEQTLERAFELFVGRSSRPGEPQTVRRQVLGKLGDNSVFSLLVRAGELVCVLGSSHFGLHGATREVPLLQTFFRDAPPTASHAEFSAVVRSLVGLGVLAPPAGQVDLGDLRRTMPICPDFGVSRGTPIDRYYLNVFIDEIRPHVKGSVLEVGGEAGNRDEYGLIWAERFVTVDLEPRPQVDLVGDVLESELFPPASFDTILCFNVLEHVADPGLAVRNMHRWLRPTGLAASMVPSVQRVHLAKKDYWRMLPDALSALHADFGATQLFVYGNALSSVGALMGIAAEELSAEELGRHHPDYPVATCITARK